MHNNVPLVSILIHNYNYGRYLRQCLDSAFSQSYPNIEVIFADNASTDESWKIALEYADKYPGDMMLIRQAKNRGPEYNSHTVWNFVNGDYAFMLCSDDAARPNMVRSAIEVMRAYPKVAFTMVHRSIMDAEGNVSEEPPFYDKSCVIPGSDQAKVYMMSSVTPSISQVVYRCDAIRANKSGLGMCSLTSRWFGPRILDFSLCSVGDVAYLAEPLLYHRVHQASDSSHMLESMVEPVGQYLLIHQLAEIAKATGMEGVAERLPEAIQKHSDLCFRYALGAISKDDHALAAKYICLAGVSGNDFYRTEDFRAIEAFMAAPTNEFKKTITEKYWKACRSFSYAPPEGSVPL
jgi:glycosyltransferase involved in cell wall biosynthesis